MKTHFAHVAHHISGIVGVKELFISTEECDGICVTPAPLATELLGVLPETIHYAPKNTKSGKRRRLRLYINKNNSQGYFVFYGINAWNEMVALGHERPWISDLKIDELANKSYANFCNPLAAMLIKLTEQELIKPGEVLR